LKNLIIY